MLLERQNALMLEDPGPNLVCSLRNEIGKHKQIKRKTKNHTQQTFLLKESEDGY